MAQSVIQLDPNEPMRHLYLTRFGAPWTYGGSAKRFARERAQSGFAWDAREASDHPVYLASAATVRGMQGRVPEGMKQV
jgi:hypothetical protein